MGAFWDKQASKNIQNSSGIYTHRNFGRHTRTSEETNRNSNCIWWLHDDNGPQELSRYHFALSKIEVPILPVSLISNTFFALYRVNIGKTTPCALLKAAEINPISFTYRIRCIQT